MQSLSVSESLKAYKDNIMPNYCKTRTWTLENNIIIQVGANIHFISFNKTTANLTILNRQNSSLNFRPSQQKVKAENQLQKSDE